MRKVIVCILSFALILGLAACSNSAASAPAATAAPAEQSTPAPTAEPTPEPEPEVVAPYGIPIWDSVEDVDLNVLFNGHSRKNLLEYFENVESVQDQNTENKNVYGTDTFAMHTERWSFLDEGRYVDNIEVSGDQNIMSSSILIILDPVNKEQSGQYQKYDADVSVFPIEAELVDQYIESSIIPLPMDLCSVKDLERSVVDGRYVFTFDLELLQEGEGGEKVELTDCVLEMDSETSLIQEISYVQHEVRTEDSEHTDTSGNTFTIPKGEQTSDIHYSYFYNVDRQPDYSLLP